MFSFLFKKQKQLTDLIQQYLDEISLSQGKFLDAMNQFLISRECNKDFDFFVEETHKAESRCDDIKDKIGMLMFEKALIPEFRGDILELLGYLDEIPNQFDRILHAIQTQNLTIPEFIVGDYEDLISVSLQACQAMHEYIKCLFQKRTDLPQILYAIDHHESHGDYIERRIIVRIFKSDIDPFQKILMRDLTLLVGDISDFALKICRFMNIIDIKRRV
jgi:predicted phosphate transport protein (TIGR00153 family)